MDTPTVIPSALPIVIPKPLSPVIPSVVEGSHVIPNRRSSERKAMLASTLPSRDGGRRSHVVEGTPNVIPSVVEGSLHSGRDDKPQSSLGHNDPAEVKASSPIRTSLFEREGSMWGLDEAAFTKARFDELKRMEAPFNPFGGSKRPK